MMDKNKLLGLIDDDEFGILNIKAPTVRDKSDIDPRLLEGFLEINAYIVQNGAIPAEDGSDVTAFLLAKRLKGIRNNPASVTTLADYDEFGLLTQQTNSQIQRQGQSVIPSREPQLPQSINDIFADADGLFSDDDDGLFTFKHTPKETTMPDYVAKRKPCPDFQNFEALFTACHHDLKQGHRIARPFSKEQQIDQGSFFILKGVLLYVAEVGEKETKNGVTNARLRLIFDNGTESDMLLRSLSAELYKDGRRVTDHHSTLLKGFDKQDNVTAITQKDTQTGYIYVLRSLSTHSELRQMQNVYKIGFSALPVAQRLKNTSKEGAYLYANVQVMAEYQCYNLNPQKLEHLLHRFFAVACLDIELYDPQGKRYTPREWFIVPLDVINEAIHLMINGDMRLFEYDGLTQKIASKIISQ